MDNKLIGKWRIDPSDEASLGVYGDVELTFTESGELIYNIYNGEKMQKMFMTYEIKGDVLITDQINLPRKEETRFKVQNGNVLQLEYEGHISRYIKM